MRTPRTKSLLKNEHTTNPVDDGPAVHPVGSAGAPMGLPQWQVRCQWCHTAMGPFLCRDDAEWLAGNHRRRCPQRPAEE
jgi:hypothetical protein